MSFVPTTFKAFEFQEFGDALDVLKLNPNATAKPLTPTDICVKVHSAALNPIDYRMLKYGKAFLRKSPSPENPIRSGFDVAGVVVAVGNGDAGSFQVGDEVFGMPDATQTGSFAQYMNIATDEIVTSPIGRTQKTLRGKAHFPCIHKHVSCEFV